MTTTNIHKHNITEKFDGEVVVLWNIGNSKNRKWVDYVHRDDYYMFIFLTDGSAKMAIDFEEYERLAPALVFILPEQVHIVVDKHDIDGWILVVDKMLVEPQYQDIFQSAAIASGGIASEDQISEINNCITILDRRLNQCNQSSTDEMIRKYITAFIGVFAEIYDNGNSRTESKRTHAITTQFKMLLSSNYKTMKSPSQYANEINISPIYLNEVIKKNTGITVTQHIHNHIIVQAKRLLYYTTMSVKEVAIELGYEDWAYFTRLFTQISTTTPTQFRERYKK